MMASEKGSSANYTRGHLVSPLRIELDVFGRRISTPQRVLLVISHEPTVSGAVAPAALGIR